jgi:hypothetical protein
MSAEVLFSFVGERWWLTALADLVVRHLTDGKESFPRTLDHAITAGGRMALERAFANSQNRDLANAVRAVATSWEARTIAELAKRDGTAKPDLEQLAAELTAEIPKHVKLPTWLRDVSARTGLSADVILNLRNSFARRFDNG